MQQPLKSELVTSGHNVYDQIMSITDPCDRFIPALDYDDWDSALDGLESFGDLIRFAKVNSLADIGGPDNACSLLAAYNLKSMVDYKLHEIGETMRKRARNIALGGAAIITLHASAGVEGMQDAVTGIDQAMETGRLIERPMLCAVTVLTSHKESTCIQIYGSHRKSKVRQLAHMAVDAGVEGLVCATSEAEMVKNDPYTEKLVVIVPAIRPCFVTISDEQSANGATSKQAYEAGADMTTAGRPFLESRLYGLSDREAVKLIQSENAA